MIDMLQAISMSLLATLVMVPLAVFSMFWMLKLLFRHLDVDRSEIRAAFDGVLREPSAFALFLGLCIVGLCILLGQVYA